MLRCFGFFSKNVFRSLKFLSLILSRICWNVILSRGSLQRKPCSTLTLPISAHHKGCAAPAELELQEWINNPSTCLVVRTHSNKANPPTGFQTLRFCLCVKQSLSGTLFFIFFTLEPFYTCFLIYNIRYIL